MRSNRSLRGLVLVLVSSLSLSVGAVAAAQPAPPPGQTYAIRTLSTSADMVTGGDVLVEVTVPSDLSPDDVIVRRDGVDVTAAFRQTGAGELLGVVDGLREGRNRLVVWGRERDWRPRAAVQVTNHPDSGPVFSGPHQEPFICETEAFGLGPPLDEDCAAETQVDYLYRSSETGEFLPLDPSAPRPSDVAQTTTSEGETVDFVVRRETGTINRAVYRITFLHEPGEPTPAPGTSTPGWNGRLVYTFGGGCNAGYHQGSSTGTVLDEDLLGGGYALASSSQNVFGTRCNDVTSAETAMMVKEHFIESFGVDRHTIGYGCSGGSMQVYLIAQNYPGILDGIVPQCSYADIVTLIGPASDCALLEHVFANAELPWSQAQKTAVSGFGDWDVCPEEWSRARETFSGVGFSLGYILPESCNPVIPEELIYDPEENPDGVRCTLQDDWVNILGRDEETGFAPRPLDNVGVQYGLEAFKDGAITFAQFLEVNELVGGFDIDGNIVAERTVADPEALHVAHATGRVNSGGGGLATTPIIDVRSYTDLVPDIHDYLRSFQARARLIEANGHADNHVIWTEAGPGVLPSRATAAVPVMARWLTAIAEDTSDAGAAEKIVANRPDDAVDTCWTAEGEKVVGSLTYVGPGVCNELYPPHADPRLAAGEPLAGDTLKCALKPVERGDYVEPLTDRQLDRLRAVFPDGVCDYDVPGIAEQPLQETWQRY